VCSREVMEGNETTSPNIETEAFSQWRVFFFLFNFIKISGIWLVAGKF